MSGPHIRVCAYGAPKGTTGPNKPQVHTAFDGRKVRADHLGLVGTATLKHAWDDWYYIIVHGTWANGNTANGVYCRERAHKIEEYLI